MSCSSDYGSRPKIEELEQDFQLSGDALALILRSIRAPLPVGILEPHRETGASPPGRTLALRARAWELFSNREEIVQWLHAQSAYLGWLTPAEVLRAGRIDRVHADLDGLAGGVYQ
jgi:hypothetical protein